MQIKGEEVARKEFHHKVLSELVGFPEEFEMSMISIKNEPREELDIQGDDVIVFEATKKYVREA
jgi:hypothetical protein